MHAVAEVRKREPRGVLDRAAEVPLRGWPVEVVAVQGRAEQGQRLGVRRVELQRALHGFGGVVHPRQRRLVGLGDEGHPGTCGSDVGRRMGRVFADRGAEALHGLAQGLLAALSQEVVAAFDEILGRERRGRSGLIAAPQGGHIAAHRQADLERGVGALGAVVALQPLAQPSRLDAHDRVAIRIEAVERPLKHFEREHRFLQPRCVATHRMLDQVAQHPLVPL